MASKTIFEIFQDNDQNKLVLTDFQRALEWNVESKKIYYLPL